MKESVFFGNEGLTSTSANYYANVAQEMIQAATEQCEVLPSVCSLYRRWGEAINDSRSNFPRLY